MKHLKILQLASIMLAAAITTASAQVPEGVFFTAQQPKQYLAADLLLKAKVHDADGKIFGDVEDLIINENNQVEGVIIGIGGFLGMGEKRIGVRYSALQFTNKDGKTVVSLPQATNDVLKSLPEYKRSRPPKSFLESVTERAKELTAKTTESTKDAYDKAKKTVDPVLEEAGKQAGEVLKKAKETASDAIEKVQQ